jgi:translation initiation factor 3 subunit C
LTFAQDPEAFQRELEAADISSAAPAKPKQPKRAAGVDGEGEAGDEAFETVGRGGRALNLTPEGVFKTLAAVLEARGKKATDRAEQTRTLEKLLAIAPSPYARLRVLLALTSSVFDYSTSTHAYMPIETWTVARSKLDELLAVLEAEQQYRVQEEVAEYDEDVDRAPEDDKPLLIRGSILSLVERLDDEFTRSLKDIDPHATEYVERLKDEKAVYEVVVRAQGYFERCDMREHLERILMRRLEHVYSKVRLHDLREVLLLTSLQPDAVISALQASLPATSGSPSDLIHTICVALYKPETDARLRARALLCHVFHYAQRGEYYRARDMLLMSHIHHAVASADVETQIMYNRAIAQLGLSAFRSGLIEECESTLRDLYSNATFVRERLAQGTARRMGEAQPTPEQEKLEKARQLPFHQHINLELLEVAYLVASMLVEVPQIALEMYDPERKRDIKSRMFRRSLDIHEKQIFAGPPENKRDHVVQAAKALQQGDWRRCVELIHSIKVWTLLADGKSVKAMLERCVPPGWRSPRSSSHANAAGKSAKRGCGRTSSRTRASTRRSRSTTSRRRLPCRRRRAPRGRRR